MNTHFSETLAGKIKDGLSIALLSDAGTPGISDPGFRLINACRNEGVPITASSRSLRIDQCLSTLRTTDR